MSLIIRLKAFLFLQILLYSLIKVRYVIFVLMCRKFEQLRVWKEALKEYLEIKNL